ncbi:MAG: dienelactone hydrolase family protein, partial [Myxococcales bacterium]|nr:dienelactone hydrolase family protein [Myxococcales bacterium]
FGLHEHIQDVCRRLAKEGYLAVSCELYARQGDVSKLDGFPAILEVVRRVPDAQVMSDLDALAAWAGAHGGDTSRMGITGFCWGGRIVWLYAAHLAGLKAGVAWYGRLKGDADPLHPTHPLEQVAALKAPVLGLYGGNDQGIPVADVEAMRAALAAAGKPGELVIYPEAPHGFHADYRPSYTAEAAMDGFAKLLAWFRQHGVA